MPNEVPESKKLAMVNFRAMDSNPEEPPAGRTAGTDFPDIDESGVDRVQIRRNLARTPSERMHSLQVLLASIIRIRRAIGNPKI